jgi:tellurite resistance protein TehA-like permease
MATGIVSLSSELLGFSSLGRYLFALNILFFIVLWLQLGFRSVLFWERIVSDIQDHKRSVGFFTLVAGTAVLGNQCILLADSPIVGLTLWFIAVIFWILLTYTIFTCLTVKGEKPSLAEGIHGGWLVSVVAAQSVSALSSLLSPHFPPYSELFLFFALVTWLGAGMLYIWIISLIFYRYTFFPMAPDSLSPPYWINMGAMAISTLAGAFLIGRSEDFRLLAELLPFIKGMTLLFWATATWWIPMLLLLGFWRHVKCRVPITYDPVYWSMVFPLGMYTASTYRLATALDLPFLFVIPRVTVYAAVLCWALTLIGLLSAIRRELVSR